MKRDPVLALLMIWAFFILIFYSFSQSKLIGYILPVVPALALIVARAFDEALDEDIMPTWMERGVIAFILILVAGLAVLKLPQADPLFIDPIAAAFRVHSGVLSLILGLGVFILVGVWGMRQMMASLSGVVMVQVLLLSSLTSLAVSLDPYLSNKSLGRLVMIHAKPEETRSELWRFL